jgi:hypothetical protein
MKRGFKEVDDARTYYPGNKKKFKVKVKTCSICRTEEEHLHRITDEEARILNAQYDLRLREGNRACCRHWVPHKNEIFKSKSRPALLKDTTEFHSAPSRRKAPAKRNVAPTPTGTPAKEPSAMTRDQLLRYVAKVQAELQQSQEREQALKDELEQVLARPYEAVFKLCASKSDEGTRQLTGM